LVTYGYLMLGVVVMLAPVLWVALSSFKSETQPHRVPAHALARGDRVGEGEGFARELPLFRVTRADGTVATMAQVRRVGIEATLVDPADPGAGRIVVPIERTQAIRKFHLGTENYARLLGSTGGRIWSSIYNTFFITIVATLITLVMNAMAAFALLQVQFRGQRGGAARDPRDPHGAGHHRAGAHLPHRVRARAGQQPLGRDPAGDLDAHGRLPAAPVHADDSRRAARRPRAWTTRASGASSGGSCCRSPRPRSPSWRSSRSCRAGTISCCPQSCSPSPRCTRCRSRSPGYTDENGIQYGMLLAMTTLTALPLALAFIFLQRYITTGIASTGIK
jgi:ABC-type glycerol-3-phosphate transport system permease component